jgi:GxxExxY protein
LWLSGTGLSGGARHGVCFSIYSFFVRETKLELAYKGQSLQTKYSPDFICFDSVVVELKALSRMSGTEEAQVINYLKATGHEVGLLINFGGRSLEHRRFVLTKSA